MIVIDASVGIKWIQEEKDSEKALKLHPRNSPNHTAILIPRLCIYEIANTLVTKFSLTDKKIKAGLRFIFQSSLQIYSEESEDYVQASLLAKKYHTAVYDMMYVVVAKKHKIILVTSDDKFIQKTDFPFVVPLAKYSAS